MTEPNKRIFWWIPLLIIATGTLICGIFLTDIPERDAVARYIPMTEAFAAGDWTFAFHPRIQPLQIICAGIIAAITGFDGFLALKTASALWFIAGGIVLFHMLREIYPDRRRIAFWGTVFYALHPYSFHLAVSGLRDSAKATLLLLIAWGLIKIYREREKRGGYWLTAAACSLGIICRVDMIPTSLIGFTIAAALEWRQKKYPLNSLYASSCLLFTMLTVSLLNSLVPGAMLPDCRMITVFIKIFHRPPCFTDALLVSLAAMAGIAAGAWILKKLMKSFTFSAAVILLITVTAGISVYSTLTLPHTKPASFIMAVIKGFYHFAGIFEIAVIITLAILKKLSDEEKFLVIFVLLNAAVNIISIQLSENILFVTSRYLAPALPLWAGFFIIGIELIYILVDKSVPHKLTNILLFLSCTAIAGGLLYHMFQPILRSRTDPKYKEMRQATFWIASFIAGDYRGSKEKELKTEIRFYQSRKSPKIFFTRPSPAMASAYFAGGSIAKRKKYADYIVSSEPPAKNVRLLMHFKGHHKQFYVWRNKQK